MKTFRRLTAATLIALIASVGAGVPSAHAATSTTACFRWSDDGTVYASQPLELWRTNSAGQLTSLLRSGRSNANGCGTFYDTPSNVYLRVVAQYNTPTGAHFDHWQGLSPRVATPGSGGANLGLGYVSYAWSI